MPNFDGCKRFAVQEWGSLLDSGDPTLIPLGRAAKAWNIKHTGSSVRSRDGISETWGSINANSPIRGLSCLEVQGATLEQYALLYTQNGELEYESSIGSIGIANPGTALSSAAVDVPASQEMLSTSAFTREYISFSDLKRGTYPPCIFDSASKTLNPLSWLPIGTPWAANTVYKVGMVISNAEQPNFNGHLYVCTAAGTSGANSPVFTTGAGDVIVDNGSLRWKEQTPAGADTAAAGNICVGDHFFVVLFQLRTGYITGMHENAILKWTAAGSKQAVISNLWAGPAGTIARIVAMTVVGTPSAGPYFYISEPDSVTASGITLAITPSVVSDNTSTSVTFNTDDNYLATGGIDVTDFFRKIQVPPCAHIYFDETMNTLVYTGVQGYESGHLVANGSDPETVFGDTGVVQVAQQDGQRTVAWCTWNGTHYSLKEESGHVVNISGQNPSAWEVNERWAGCGPCGPLAWGKCERFLCFAHRSGLYIFFGDVPWPVVANIVDRLWDRINWQYQHKIWVVVDDDEKEVLVGVPLDEATDCNIILKMSYIAGFETPMTTERRKRMAFFGSLKWSIDDIPASRGLIAKRELVNVNADPVDQRAAHKQFLLASNTDDGVINMFTPEKFDDNGKGIHAIFEPGWANAGGAVLQLGGVVASVAGAGDLKLSLYQNGDEQDKPSIDLGDWDLSEYRNRDIAVETWGASERFKMRFETDGQPGSYFDLRVAAIMAQMQSAAREG